MDMGDQVIQKHMESSETVHRRVTQARQASSSSLDTAIADASIVDFM